MIYREYIELLKEFDLKREEVMGYYMDRPVCMFWFDICNHIVPRRDDEHTGCIKIVDDTKIDKASTDIQEARESICERMKEIKADQIIDKLKNMRGDFE
jgi:hypothetical protein